MTKIMFYKSGDVFYGFRETGHSEYKDAGQDILCSALSAMTMLVEATIEDAIGTKVDCKINKKTADVEIIVKGALPKYEPDENKSFAAAKVILGFYLQVTALTEEWSDYLQIDSTEREI